MENIKDFNNFTSSEEVNESTTALSGGGDFDHFGEIAKPLMDAAGFKWVGEKAQYGQASGYADGYYCYPNHNTGVNLYLDKPLSGAWKYVVYLAPNKLIKEFGWKTGTGAEVNKAATDAANYAIALKTKNFK
jgi:hypothetical protein